VVAQTEPRAAGRAPGRVQVRGAKHAARQGTREARVRVRPAARRQPPCLCVSGHSVDGHSPRVAPPRRARAANARKRPQTLANAVCPLSAACRRLSDDPVPTGTHARTCTSVHARARRRCARTPGDVCHVRLRARHVRWQSNGSATTQRSTRDSVEFDEHVSRHRSSSALWSQNDSRARWLASLALSPCSRWLAARSPLPFLDRSAAVALSQSALSRSYLCG
jgi:hypothetical protein